MDDPTYDVSGIPSPCRLSIRGPGSGPISDFPKFCLTAGANQHYSDSVSSHRGAARDRHGRGAGCGGRCGARDERGLLAYGQVVSFWRPNAGVKSARRSAGDGVKQAWSPGRAGEREVSRKTIARGMPGDFRCDRGDYARVFVFYHTRGCGCIERPAFPAPSDLQKAGRSWQNLARKAAARSRAVSVHGGLFEEFESVKVCGVYERATRKLSSLRKQGPINTAVSCYESR